MTITRQTYAVIAVVLAGCLAACQIKKDVSGSWQGSLRFTEGNQTLSLPVELLLSQSGTTVNGTVTLKDPKGSENRLNLQLTSGVFTNSRLSFKASEMFTMEIDFDGRVTGDRLSGTVRGMTLGGSGAGTLEATRKK